VWCGKGDAPTRKKGDLKYYYKKGTPYECMQKGFGSGMYSERDKSLPRNSLQKIKYVGKTYEDKFKKEGINTIFELRDKMIGLSVFEKEKLLKRVFTQKGGRLDLRAYNSALVFLYQNYITELPKCSRILP